MFLLLLLRQPSFFFVTQYSTHTLPLLTWSNARLVICVPWISWREKGLKSSFVVYLHITAQHSTALQPQDTHSSPQEVHTVHTASTHTHTHTQPYSSLATVGPRIPFLRPPSQLPAKTLPQHPPACTQPPPHTVRHSCTYNYCLELRTHKGWSNVRNIAWLVYWLSVGCTHVDRAGGRWACVCVCVCVCVW